MRFQNIKLRFHYRKEHEIFKFYFRIEWLWKTILKWLLKWRASLKTRLDTDMVEVFMMCMQVSFAKEGPTGYFNS